jgi:hypothetical protein
LRPESRAPFLARAAVAALAALALSAMFLYDQVTITAVRDGGWPFSIGPLPVLGDAVPDGIRRLLDVPAYWLIYLPVEFPAFYAAGVVALFLLFRKRSLDDERRRVLQAFALLLGVSLLCAWLLIADLGGNNDLGWRAVLPGVLLLICFAAAGLAQWIATRRRALAAIAVAGLLLGLPEGISWMRSNATGKTTVSGAGFARSPALWDAVRRHSSPADRIANNPHSLSELTPWPVNIAWALLSNRRSCYAGRNLGIPFAPVSAARRSAIDAQFLRVFDGKAEAGDVQQLADRFGCDLVIVTAQDGAWTNDPFASGGAYRLVEMRPDEWRIYRKAR